MTVYQIDYNLKGLARNRDSVEKEIQALGASIQVFRTTWFVDTDRNHDEIRDTIKDAMSRNDQVLVTKLQGTWATSGISDHHTEWLEEHG